MYILLSQWWTENFPSVRCFWCRGYVFDIFLSFHWRHFAENEKKRRITIFGIFRENLKSYKICCNVVPFFFSFPFSTGYKASERGEGNATTGSKLSSLFGPLIRLRKQEKMAYMISQKAPTILSLLIQRGLQTETNKNEASNEPSHFNIVTVHLQLCIWSIDVFDDRVTFLQPLTWHPLGNPFAPF